MPPRRDKSARGRKSTAKEAPTGAESNLGMMGRSAYSPARLEPVKASGVVSSAPATRAAVVRLCTLLCTLRSPKPAIFFSACCILVLVAVIAAVFVAAAACFNVVWTTERIVFGLLLGLVGLVVMVLGILLAISEHRRVDFEKESFYRWMMAISSSSSGETSSAVDGTPEPEEVPVADFFSGFPEVSEDAVSRFWGICIDNLASWVAPAATNLDENRDVHPSVAAVLVAVVPPWLRVWRNLLAEDDVNCAKIRPDFTITDHRDAVVSVIGALLVVEVKLPGDLVSAVNQTRAYLRRRVYKLCCERDALGEPCDGIFAIGIATDGIEVVFVRVVSGVPAPGGSFAQAVPCPTSTTEPLPLFRGWSFFSRPRFSRARPPAGFCALARLMMAPVSLLGTDCPLDRVNATLTLLADNRASQTVLEFESRLGSGGSSDVYKIAGHNRLVVKLARFATAAVCQSYEAERVALFTLRQAAQSGLVPELVGVGRRNPDGAWPLLLLSPPGMQLPAWVKACIEKTDHQLGSAGSSASVRLNCARIVASSLLDALAAAHAANIAHCDVRPLNVVIVNDQPMLVDWGSSRRFGIEAAGCGVAAYASMSVFKQKTFVARPAQDIAGVLYTWFCIAFDGGCVAPWFLHHNSGNTTMFAKRTLWITGQAVRHESAAAIAHALQSIESSPAQTRSVDLVARARAAINFTPLRRSAVYR